MNVSGGPNYRLLTGLSSTYFCLSVDVEKAGQIKHPSRYHLSSVDVQIMVWMCKCDISLLCASTDVAHSVGQRFCLIAILRVERVFWQNIVNHGVWVTQVTEFDFIKSSSTSRISVCPVSIVTVCHSESVLHKNRHPKPVLNIHLVLQAGPTHTFKYIVSIQTFEKFSN